MTSSSGTAERGRRNVLLGGRDPKPQSEHSWLSAQTKETHEKGEEGAQKELLGSSLKLHHLYCIVKFELLLRVKEI